MHLSNKIFYSIILALWCDAVSCMAQGWPENYGGVMLQGFYWDSFTASKWTTMTKQADELSKYFSLIWVPQSGNCDGKSMGYNPKYYFDQNSSFGTEKDLRAMIAAYKERGTGMIADVVVNHRSNVSNWVDFPAETYRGITYQMQSTDIVANDDGGATRTWASQNGYSLSTNADEGEDWSGMRDLDHRSANVQSCVKAYTKYLIEDLGYTGFRYDMVKGFNGSHVADYNINAGVEFSVGECWDSNTVIKNWINATKTNNVPQSAAFDFQFRYQVRDALNQNNYSRLAGSNGLIFDTNYRRYAVTFIENHDTEYRSSSSPQDPIKGDTLGANAYLLAMPGTPCVFFKHWLAHKTEIKQMIEGRKLAGITNTSTFSVKKGDASLCYAVEVTGSKGRLLAVIGRALTMYTVPQGYNLILSGSTYRYYVSQDVDTTGWKATMDRIAAESVEPAPEPFTPYTITVNARTENNWSKMNFYVWAGDDDTQLNGNWPGKAITATREEGGYTWYYQTFNIPKRDYVVNLVFSTGTGAPQTVDVTDVTTDKYFVITSQKSGAKYLVDDVTDQYDAIVTPFVDKSVKASNAEYNLNGQRINSNFRGIVLRNGRKAYRK